jgi:hypothetical protein
VSGALSSQELDIGLLLLLVGQWRGVVFVVIVLAIFAAIQGKSGLALVVGNVGVQPSGQEKQAEIELSVYSNPVQSISPIFVDCGELRASVDEKPGGSNIACKVKRGLLPLISGVDISSMVLQQFRNGRILCIVKWGTLILISGVDISSRVQQQLRNSLILCIVKRDILELSSGVDISSMVQQQFCNGLILCTVKRGPLPTISGVDISSMVQQQLHNGLILCKVKWGTLIFISGVEISSLVQQISDLPHGSSFTRNDELSIQLLIAEQPPHSRQYITLSQRHNIFAILSHRFFSLI